MTHIPPPAADTPSGPAPYYSDASLTVHHGDCLEVLSRLASASVDAVVTDPPYGLEFMGKDWDTFGDTRQPFRGEIQTPDNPYGRSTVRYAGTSTYASKANATRRQEGGIPQASGPSFLGGLNPKCLVCDRWQRGSNPCKCEAPEWTQERLVRLHSFQEWCESWAGECLRVLRPGGHMLAFGGTRMFHRLTSAVEDAGFEIRDSIAWLYGSGFPKSLNLLDEQGERTGWGTALKPAFEPVVVARKPLVGTVAANVQAHGTGALNIDGCRTEVAEGDALRTATYVGSNPGSAGHTMGDGWADQGASVPMWSGKGRWPANVVLDEAQAEVLDEQSGVLTSGKMAAGTRPKGERETFGRDAAAGYETQRDTPGDSGGASRFFYVAKADSSERVRVDGVAHPTVKPLALMRWLVRLVTPPGGTVLEPFAGSGTTVEACILEGFRCIAIERDETYLPLIRQRIDRRRDPVAAVRGAGEDGGLFDLLGEASA